MSEMSKCQSFHFSAIIFQFLIIWDNKLVTRLLELYLPEKLEKMILKD